MTVTKCAVHGNDIPCAECRAGVKCAVENCPNMTHEGEFVQSICSPCWAFLRGDSGGHRSQAYRNARERFIHMYVVATCGAFLRVEGQMYTVEYRQNVMKGAWQDAADIWHANYPDAAR